MKNRFVHLVGLLALIALPFVALAQEHPTIYFSVSPSPVAYGAPSMVYLSASSPNVHNCTISGGGFNSTDIAIPNETPTYPMTSHATYSILCHATDDEYPLTADPVAVYVAPICSVSFTTNPINQPSGTYLNWSSTNADSWLYINNVGYVNSSGSTYVAPSSTTDYSCYARGYGGDSGWQTAILSVNQSCTFNSATVTHGNSVTAYQKQNVGYGKSCTSETRTCSNGSLSGSYAYASCTVAGASSCTLDGVTVPHGSSATFYSTQTAPSGTTCTGESGGSALSQSRTCSDGTLSGSSSYQYSSCSCTPTYSCSSSTIQYTNSSCSTSDVTTCTSPAFCSAGSSVCLYAPVAFNSNGSFTGHLFARPSLVPQGIHSRLYWDLSNVSSCSVQGTNSQSWTGASSGTSGEATAGLTQQTTFTLSCTPSDPSATFTPESVTVNIIPVFQEN